MQHFIGVVGLLGLIFTWIEEDVGTQSLFMKILTSLTIRAVSGLVVLLARLGLIFDVGQCLSFKLMSTVSKAALEICYLLQYQDILPCLRTCRLLLIPNSCTFRSCTFFYSLRQIGFFLERYWTFFFWVSHYIRIRYKGSWFLLTLFRIENRNHRNQRSFRCI